MFDLVCDIRRLHKGERDVGQGSEGTQGDRVITVAQRIDQKCHGVCLLLPLARRLQRHAGKAVSAADELGGVKWPQDRPGASLEYRHLRAPCKLADSQGIDACLIDRHIARNGCDTAHFETIGGAQCKQQGERVVLTGISIDDDLAVHAPPRFYA